MDLQYLKHYSEKGRNEHKKIMCSFFNCSINERTLVWKLNRLALKEDKENNVGKNVREFYGHKNN